MPGRGDLDARNDADPVKEGRKRLGAAGALAERLLEHDHAADAALHAICRDEKVPVAEAVLRRGIGCRKA